MLAVALAAPVVILVLNALSSETEDVPRLPDGLIGLAMRPQAIALLDDILQDGPISGLQTGCMVVQFDEADTLLDRHGRAAQTEVLARSAERLCAALRAGDVVARPEGGGLAVVLAPQRRLDLESMIQLAAQLQASIATPISLNAARLYVTCSIGFCLGANAPEATGRALLDAAQIAADEAQRNGPGAIRAFSTDMPSKRADRDALRAVLETALDEGQIRPHFQPQVCAPIPATFRASRRWRAGITLIGVWCHRPNSCLPSRNPACRNVWAK